MALSDIFVINITTAPAAITQQGFGTPLILAPNATYPERVRTYSDLAGVLVDFAATTPEYKQAAVLFAQSPRPPQVKMGRLANKPTQHYTLTPAQVLNSTKYAVKVNDVEVSFTSDSSATLAEICTGLAAAIVASGFTVASTGTTVTVTANTAGAWLSLEVSDPSLLTSAMDHADPGVAADLAAINLENPDWYCLLSGFNSKLMAAAAAAWVESNGKLFICSTSDTECATVVAGSATDIMKTLQTSAYARTSVWYHPDPSDFLGAMIAGVCLPKTPGSETWFGKRGSSTARVKLTPTHIVNLRAKNGNSYYDVIPNFGWTFDGKVASGDYIDTVRYRDKLQARIGERCITKTGGADKIAYTDEDAAILEAEIAAELAQGVIDKALVPGSIYTSVAATAAQSSTDRGNRVFNGITFGGQIAGAIQGGTFTGTFTV